jgi:hypothetical protein
VSASKLAFILFFFKNKEDRTFNEYLANYMQNNDEKIQSIVVKTDNFSDNTSSLEQYLPHK